MAHSHTKYTRAQIDAALDRVRRGYTVPEAARLSGVNRSKIARELKKQEQYDTIAK